MLAEGPVGRIRHRISPLLPWKLVTNVARPGRVRHEFRHRSDRKDRIPRAARTANETVAGDGLRSYGGAVRATDQWRAGNTIDAAETRGGGNRCSGRQHTENPRKFPGCDQWSAPPIGGSFFRHARSGQERKRVCTAGGIVGHSRPWAATAMSASTMRRVCPAQARACGQERENLLNGEGGIAAGEPGGMEPPRRMSGGRCSGKCSGCCTGSRAARWR